MASLYNSKQQTGYLFQQGLERYKQRQFQKVSEGFRQALKIYTQINDITGIAKSAYNLGLALTIQSDPCNRGEFFNSNLPSVTPSATPSCATMPTTSASFRVISRSRVQNRDRRG
jgi:predicted Zn-ribbon and HTH transcriptional regulator